MRLIKLTAKDGMTHGGMKWRVGSHHKLPVCDNPELCSKDVLHAYRGVNLALLLNPIHANFDEPRLYEVEAEICVEDWGKVGCFRQKVIRRLPVPAWYADPETRLWVQQLTFAILCAEAVLPIYEVKYPQDDRPRKAIETAKKVLKNGAEAAAGAAGAARAAALDFVALADQAVVLVESGELP